MGWGAVMDVETAGKAAALSAAALWAVAVTLFTFASHKVGAQVVNATRLTLALATLIGLHFVLLGAPWPTTIGGAGTMWLLASGLVGFALADGFGLESFVRVGPRLGMLVQTLAPVFAALLAWMLLEQRLSWLKGGAIAVTLAGIALVIMQGPEGVPSERRRTARWHGILFAVGAALGQAIGQLTAVKGLEGGVSPFSATIVRLAGGWAGTLLVVGLRGELRHLRSPWTSRTTAVQMVVGTTLGSTLGVPLALYSLAHAPLGIAATLMYMVPVFLLPISHFSLGERITPRAVWGTLLTVGGAAGLFLLR